MKRTLLYTRSILEIILGVLFGIAAVRAVIMAVVDIVALVPYWSLANFENTAGDALGGLVAFLLAKWLLKDGRRVWGKATNPIQGLAA